MKIVYENFSSHIFQGFYSGSYYSINDILEDYSLNDELEDGQYYDLLSEYYKKIKNEIGENFVSNLKTVLPNDIIKHIAFSHIWSPREYNFYTDKINIEMNFNFLKLKKYCFQDKAEQFNKYLHDKWTSCDGFWSFVDNDIDRFKKRLEEKKDDYIQVMIEFYLLQNVDFTSLNMNVYEDANNIIIQYVCVYDTNKHGYFEFEFDENDKVKITKQIA